MTVLSTVRCSVIDSVAEVVDTVVLKLLVASGKDNAHIMVCYVFTVNFNRFIVVDFN